MARAMTTADDRAERLAKALRDNLKRRKAQSRAAEDQRQGASAATDAAPSAAS